MYVKGVDTCHFVFDSVLDWCKTQEMCDKVISEDRFMLKYCPDKSNTQEMGDKAVKAFLPALKFVPDWFVTSKIIKKLDDALFVNDDIIFMNKDSNNITFFGGDIGVLSVDLDKIYLDDVNFDEDDPEIIIHVRRAV